MISLDTNISSSGPMLPARPAAKLPDLAEAVMAAVKAKAWQDCADMNGTADELRKASDLAQKTKRRMLAAFADIGLSYDWLHRLGDVL